MNANTESLKALLEPAAQRIASAIGEAIGGRSATDVPPEMAGDGRHAAQISPLLLGAQVGAVLGFLAQRVLGQYDVAVPRSGPAPLLFVVPNIAQFERDWSSTPPSSARSSRCTR